MNLGSIKNERPDLRNWFKEQMQKQPNYGIEWVEPNVFLGATTGSADCIIKHYTKSIPLELKHLELKTKGIEWKFRPVQRRWHHMGMRKGQRSAALCTSDIRYNIVPILIRGDRIPLRDYESDEGSGCEFSKAIYTSLAVGEPITNLLSLIFGEEFWK
jgi:hypothetical protein